VPLALFGVIKDAENRNCREKAITPRHLQRHPEDSPERGRENKDRLWGKPQLQTLERILGRHGKTGTAHRGRRQSHSHGEGQRIPNLLSGTPRFRSNGKALVMSEEFKVFDDIARFVLSSEHGGFLKAFADAWLRADPDNKRLLQKAWANIIVKYDLNAEYAESTGAHREALKEQLGRELTQKEIETSLLSINESMG